MGVPFIPGLAGFAITPASQVADTAVVGLVPPFPGLSYGPVNVGVGVAPNPIPNWYGQPHSRVTILRYTTGLTAHTVYVMKPLNWTTFSAAVARNTTAVALTTDPGLYSTSFNYPENAGNAPVTAADNALAAADYVAFQLDDGTWLVDTVSSGTYAAVVLTTGTPDRAGATVAANRPLFWFGAVGDSNPATGIAHTSFLTVASTNKIDQIGATYGEGLAGRMGDPLLVVSNNITNAGVLDLVAGAYERY